LRILVLEQEPMRKRLFSLLVFAAVLGADLAWSPPVQAQVLGGSYDFNELSPGERKAIRRKQRLITFGVLGVVGAVGSIIIGLNIMERKSERRRQMQLYAERMEKGLV